MKRRFLTAMAVACWLGASALAQVGAGEKAAHPAGLTLKSAVALALETDPLRKAALADEKMAAARRSDPAGRFALVTAPGHSPLA